MSYCRWSSDSFRCDVYCYGHVDGGFALHIAGNRVPDDAPIEGPMPTTNDTQAWDAWFKRHRALMEYLNTCERIPIEHEEAGKHYHYTTARELRDKLVELKGQGFIVPDWAIKDVEAEFE